MQAKTIGKIAGGVLTAAATLISVFEGVRQTDYFDPVGIPTACVGHTGKDVKVGRQRTLAECRALLADDLQVAWDSVSGLVRVPLKPYQQIAFMSFVFNSGSGNFASSTMLRKLNQGDYIGACNELPKWIYATQYKLVKYPNGEVKLVPQKVILPGLPKRRDVERRVCLGQKVPQVDLEGLTE